MAYGKNINQFILKEGDILIGTWASPNALVPTVDPTTSFTEVASVGYFQQGTFAPAISRTFAEFLAGTPGKKVRKDLTLKQWSWASTFAQINEDLLGLVQGSDVDTGDFAIAWLGNDEPAQAFNGYLNITQLVDDTEIAFALWYGKVTSENVGISLPGTEHGTYEFMVEAFEAPAFSGVNANDEHNYGAIIINNSTTPFNPS